MARAKGAGYSIWLRRSLSFTEINADRFIRYISKLDERLQNVENAIREYVPQAAHRIGRPEAGDLSTYDNGSVLSNLHSFGPTHLSQVKTFKYDSAVAAI